MPSVDQQSPHGKAYWRSLDELADTPAFREFLHREFPAGAADLIDSDQRRQFLKIMGASLALAVPAPPQAAVLAQMTWI